MGLNSEGSLALSFFEIKVVRDSWRCLGKRPASIIKFRMRLRMFNGTALNSFPDIPSGPGAVPTGGRALDISEGVIGFHSSFLILGGTPGPGVV